MQNTCAKQCAELAYLIALIRREKYLKDKGRKCTPRSIQQYTRRRCREDMKHILIEANAPVRQQIRRQKLYGITPRDMDSSTPGLLTQLQYMLARENRYPGRPRKATGIIRSKMHNPAKSRGRPRTIEPEDEEVWIHRLWGVAAALWAEREWLPLNMPFDKVLAILGQQPNGITELERLFPEAIRSQTMAPYNPPAKSVKSLIERARTARRIYPLPAKLKSGG